MLHVHSTLFAARARRACSERRAMQRRIGLLGATAINIITMIGIGPLVTVPLVLSALVGPTALLAWIAGALVALCDGMVWAELGSRFPGSGGTYTFLRESFGASRWGRGLAFLFTWQMLLFAPALLASGAIGAVQYTAYLVPSLAHDTLAKGVLASVLALLMTLGLLTRLEIVQKLSRAFAVVAIVTLIVAIAAGLMHPVWQHLLAFPTLHGSWPSLALAFGTGLYIALYDYVGYAQATMLGDELQEPANDAAFDLLGHCRCRRAVYPVTSERVGDTHLR
ncbi:MAG: APC family permease [Vulcanimicrobiaceae bacterium]